MIWSTANSTDLPQMSCGSPILFLRREALFDRVEVRDRHFSAVAAVD